MELAVKIVTRLAEGKPLTVVCRQAGMPGLTTVYKWLAQYEEFDKLMRRARVDVADTFFSRAVEVAEKPCANSVEVQRNRLLIDTLKWAAQKMAPRRYGDQLAIGGAPDLPPLEVSEFEGARRIAFILARADHRLMESAAEAAAAPPPPPSSSQSRRASTVPASAARRTVASSERTVDYEAERDAEAIGRIGDPERVMSDPEPARAPLSAKGRG